MPILCKSQNCGFTSVATIFWCARVVDSLRGDSLCLTGCAVRSPRRSMVVLTSNSKGLYRQSRLSILGFSFVFWRGAFGSLMRTRLRPLACWFQRNYFLSPSLIWRPLSPHDLSCRGVGSFLSRRDLGIGADRKEIFLVHGTCGEYKRRPPMKVRVN